VTVARAGAAVLGETVVGSFSIFTSGVLSHHSVSAFDRFGNALRGSVIVRVCESSNPSFNNILYSSGVICDDRSNTMISVVPSDGNIPLSATALLVSARSSRIAVESWFLHGPSGLSSTYYADCSWSNPLESLLSSLPLFRPIGSDILSHNGLQLGGNTHPCSVQWSALLRVPSGAQESYVSFELGSNFGSCLTLFINDKSCCDTCQHISRSGMHRFHRSRNYCSCSVEDRGSLSKAFWPLSLYGNSDGDDPDWTLKWFSRSAHPGGFQHITDGDVVPSSRGESSVAVLHGA
jgi:hypothetical protein